MQIWNKCLEKLILPLSDHILNNKYYSTVQQWRKIQSYDKDRLEQLQKENLQKLLEYAVNKIEYYKPYAKRHQKDPYVWLKTFPIMYKSIMKKNIDELVFGDTKELIEEKSSGSSGEQNAIYMDKKEHAIPSAIQTLWWEWAGYKFGNSILQTGMTTNRGIVKKVKDTLLRTTYVSAFTLDEQAILGVIKELEKVPKQHFTGYASSLYLFAKVASEHKIDSIKFDSVISWGDKMFPHYRKLIEEQFSTTVYDTYGCTEGLMIAGECEEGNYHIMTPHIYLELLDEDGNDVDDGQIGYVVVTRLDAYSMPLIRYYLGDLAVKADQSEICSCGKKFPLLKKIIGRDTDIVKTRTGKFLIVHFFTAIFEHIPQVLQFQVIQKNLDSIDILYITGNEFHLALLDNIKKKIIDYIQEDFEINFIQVDKIETSKSGKPQMIRSYLEKNNFSQRTN